MPWSSILGAVAGPLLGGLFGSSGGPTAGANPAQYDPFQAYRPQYAGQLNTLMANPNSVTSLPGFQLQFGQGMEAVQRAMAAQGKNLSGAEMLALQNQGQVLAGQYYNQQLATLSQLSGATQSPAAGYTAALAGNQNYMNNITGWGAVGSQLGRTITNIINGADNSGGGNSIVNQWNTGSF